MALTVATQNLGYLDIERQIEEALENVFKNRDQNWGIVILGAQDNTKWEITIKGPQSYVVRYTLYGEDGGHDPRYIAALFNAELNPAAREMNLVIRIGSFESRWI